MVTLSGLRPDPPLTEDALSVKHAELWGLDSTQQLLIFYARKFPGHLGAWFFVLWCAGLVITYREPSVDIHVAVALGICLTLFLMRLFWVHKECIIFDRYSKELITYRLGRRSNPFHFRLAEIICVRKYRVQHFGREYHAVTWDLQHGETESIWRCEYPVTAHKLAQALSTLANVPIVEAPPDPQKLQFWHR